MARALITQQTKSFTHLRESNIHLTSCFRITSNRQQSTMTSQPHSERHASISSTHKATNPHLKHPAFGHLPLSTSGPQDCALKGTALLSTPYFNKGAGFPAEERREFKLTGLLPQNVQTLDQQVKRAYQQFSTRQDNLAKNTFMTSLAEQNQVLYFRVRELLLDFRETFQELSPSWLRVEEEGYARDLM